MKKSIWVMIAVVVLTTATVACAQPMGEGMGEGKMMGKGMPGHEMMDKKMMGPMMSMRQTTMIATEDGGIVVLRGNTLTKYDKDLNVVKEVELKPKKMKDLPMMKDKMMEEDEKDAQ